MFYVEAKHSSSDPVSNIIYGIHPEVTTAKSKKTPSYFIDLPLKMESLQCSETSAISTQTPGKHPKENILHLKKT
jgi:hypothetical protein